MNYARFNCFLFLIMLIAMSSHAGSIVYNFRIAQITKQAMHEKVSNSHYTLVSLLFDQFQKRHTGVKENYAGGFCSVIYDINNYYVRMDGALARLSQKESHKTHYSDVQTDDLLFTVGRNFHINDRSLLTLSGLLGVPTHDNHSLQHLDFGYAQVGTGLQLDGSYSLKHDRDSALLYGLRYIYFVPTTTFDCLGNKYRFSIGNLGDILAAYKKYWYNTHGIEFGYSFRSDFGAQVHPLLDDTVQKTNYNRSNFYFVYKYKFAQDHTLHRFLFNIAYGFYQVNLTVKRCCQHKLFYLSHLNQK